MTFQDILKANESIKTTTISHKDKKTGKVKSKEYAEVNERIKAFRSLCPNGRIDTVLLSNENGVCVFRAEIYGEDGKMLGAGTAYEKEDSSFINSTSYIENCETSAVGRALGMCGFGIDNSVASYEEVGNAMKQQEQAEQKLDAMTVEDAEQLIIPFGKYKGEMLGHIMSEDENYIAWLAENATSPDIQKAAKLICDEHFRELIYAD